MWNLWLDDIRDPKYPGTVSFDWQIARTFQEAHDLVLRNGPPGLASLDHDLGTDEPSGMEFVKWLINQHLDGRLDLSTTKLSSHSANTCGRDNIDGIWDSFRSFLEK